MKKTVKVQMEIWDLRVGDSDAITSSMMGWLYLDMRLKPQELMLYRQSEFGGLGLFNVKLRSIATLIHTFLAKAILQIFTTNCYLN